MVEQNKESKKGFTLVELMIVVIIIGVLSAVAVPTLVKFTRRSKETEATLNLAAIARGAQEYFQQERVNNATGIVLPSQYPSAANSTNRVAGFATTPIKLPCQAIAGSPKYPANVSAWYLTTDPWRDLKFSIATAHYFQYGYQDNRRTGVNAAFTVRARADLDCDTILSEFRLIGRVNPATSEQVKGGIFVIRDGE